MCNAWNHYADCACGFGPPYPWRLEVIESVSWLDRSLADRSAFRRRLLDLGIEPGESALLLSDYAELLKLELSTSTLRSRLRKLLSRLEYRLGEPETVCLLVPLFRFCSPLPGAVVHYREKRSEAERSGWLVRLEGIGMGRTREVEVTTGHTFSAFDDECKQVFLPLEVTVREVSVYKAGVLKGRGLQAELKGTKKLQNPRGCGAQALPPDGCAYPALPANASCDDVYDLRGDNRPSDHQLYKRFEEERSLHFGIDRFGLKTEMKGSIRRRQEVEIESHLPGGHDYRLWVLPEGLQWRLDLGASLPVVPLWGTTAAAG